MNWMACTFMIDPVSQHKSVSKGNLLGLCLPMSRIHKTLREMNAISTEVSILCFAGLQSKVPRGEDSKAVMKRKEMPSSRQIQLVELAG